MASGRGAGSGRDHLSLWAGAAREKGWTESRTSLGTRYFTDPNDPLGRWIIDPRNPTRWMRVPWHLIDNPYEGGETNSGGKTHSTRRTQSGQEGREITASAAEGVVAAIYGEVLMGGDITAHHVNGLSYWAQYGLGQGEILGVQAMYLPFGTSQKTAVAPSGGGGSPFFSSVLYEVRTGTLSQTVSTYAARAHNEYGTLTQIFPGFAFVAAQFLYHTSLLPESPRPKFLVRGRKIYDPRLDVNLVANNGVPTRNATTVVYSKNSILIAADYAADNDFGYGLGDAGVDWIALKAEADKCDVVIGGEKRFETNIVLRREADQEAILETLLMHCRGRMTPRRGKVVLWVESARASVFTFDLNNSKPLRVRRTGSSKIPTAGLLSWTNPSKGWILDPIPIETTNAKNGIDEVRRAEWVLEGVTQPGQAARLLAFLFGVRRSNLDATIMPTTPEAEQIEPGDHVLYDEPVAGFAGGIDLSAERLTDDPTGRRTFELSLYSAALYSDATGVIETLPDRVLDDPYAALPAPTVLTLTQLVDEVLPGVFVPKVSVAFTPYAGPSYGGTKIEYRVNAGAWTSLPSVDTGPVEFIVSAGAGKLVEVRASTVNRLTGIAGTSTISNSLTTYDASTPPKISKINSKDVGGGHLVYYWDQAPIRDTSLHGAGEWSHIACTLFTAAQVNNGNLATAAIQMNTVAYTSVTLTLPAPLAIREWIITLSAGDFSGALFSLQYADAAGGPFTDIPPGGYHGMGSSDRDSAVTWTLYIDKMADGVTPIGAHKYWRFLKDAGSAFTGTIAEIQPVSFSGVWPYVKGYEITAWSQDSNAAYTFEIPLLSTNETTGVDENAIKHSEDEIDPVSGSIQNGVSIYLLEVRTLSVTRAESAPVGFSFITMYSALVAPTAQHWEHLGIKTVAVGSGLVNTLAITGGGAEWIDNLLRIDATGAVTIGGIPGGHAGRTLHVHAVDFPVTLAHENLTTAIAGERFSLPGAKDLIIAVGQQVQIIYDDVLSRWLQVDAYRNQLVEPSTFGAIGITGAKGGWSGIEFQAAGRTLMVAEIGNPIFPGVSGLHTGAAFVWRFTAAGVLDVGTVPIASVTGGAPLASPALTGVPTAPTAALGTSTTQLATTAFAMAMQVAWSRLTGQPTTLAGYGITDGATDTELANGLALKANLASPALTGVPTAPTAAGGTNTTQLATTAFVQQEIAAKAPLASPALTGNPTAPTPTTTDNDTSIATTAYVRAQRLTGSKTYDPPNIAGGGLYVSTTVTVTGAAVGDTALPTFSIDTQGIILYARVETANTVRVWFFNPEDAGGLAINLGSGTLTVDVFVR
jgi:hypothetical protein